MGMKVCGMSCTPSLNPFKKEVVINLENTTPNINGPKKSFYAKWRLVPALVPVATLTFVLAFNLLHRRYDWALPTGVGLLFSLFPVYLAYDWDNLTSFSKNNSEYAHHNARFGIQIEEMRKELEVTKEENDRYKANNLALSGHVDRLKDELGGLESKNIKLQELIDKYERDCAEFKKVTTEHTLNLEKLKDSLISVNEKAHSNHNEFDQSVSNLREVAGTIALSQNTFDAKMQDVCGFMVTVMEGVSEWKKANQLWEERIERLHEIQRNINAEREKFHSLDVSVQLREAKADELTGKVDELTNKIKLQEESLKKVTSDLDEAKQALLDAQKEVRSSVKMLQLAAEEQSKLSHENSQLLNSNLVELGKYVALLPPSPQNTPQKGKAN